MQIFTDIIAIGLSFVVAGCVIYSDLKKKGAI